MLFKYKLLGRPFRSDEGGGGGDGGGGDGGSNGGDSTGGSGSNESSAESSRLSRSGDASSYNGATQAATGGWSMGGQTTPSTGGGSNSTASSGFSSAADSQAASAVDSNQSDENQSPAETARLTNQNAGTDALGNITPGSDVSKSNNTNYSSEMFSTPTWLDRTMGLLGFVPGLQPLSAAYWAGKPLFGLSQDMANPNIDTKDAISKFAKDEIGGFVKGKLTGIINGEIGKAVGPDGAAALGNYQKAASLYNIAQDNPKDMVPTSAGSYVWNAVTGGQPAYNDGLQHAANGDVINSSGWASHSSPPVVPDPTPQVAVADPTPKAEIPSGVIGNYLQWFNQGRGTLKQKGA